MRFVPWLFIVIFVSSCGGQSLEQDGGDLTRSEVEYLSEKMVAAVEVEYPLLKHKMVNRYLNSLGQSLVANNPAMPPLPYEFRVVKSNDVFAFSLPGGIIYISLGALRAMELEGQLAAALAHELAHQQLNHPLISWRRKVNSNRGQKYLLDFGSDWRKSFLGEDGALYFPKGMEQEADQLAPVILYRAKFDPRLYSSYLQILRKLDVSHHSAVENLMGLHPPIEKRLNWAKDVLARLPPLKDAGISSASFLQIRAILDAAEKKGKERQVLE